MSQPSDQASVEGTYACLQISAASDDTGDPLTYAATGLPPGLSVSADTGLISGTLTADISGSYSVTVSVSENGDPDSRSFTWNVDSLTNPGTQTNAEGDTVSLAIQAADDSNSPETFGATGLPAGLTVDPVTGIISGIVAYSDAQTSAVTYNVTLTASWEGVGSDSKTFTWTINDTNRLADPGPQSNAEGDTVYLQLQATDNTGATLTYAVAGILPDGLTFDPNTQIVSGILDYTDAQTNGGTYTITASVSDGVATDVRAFTWTVTDTNRLVNPGDQTNAEGDRVSLSLQATDNTGATLTFAASNLPAGLTLDPATGIITGILKYSDAQTNNGTYQITASVTGGGATDTRTFTWTVTDTNRIAPIGALTNAEGDLSLHWLYATDNTGAALTWQVTGLPAGTFLNTTASWFGLLDGVILYGDAATNGGNYAVTFSVSDGVTTDTRTFAWTITAGTVPTFNPLALPNPVLHVTFTSDFYGVTPGTEMDFTWSNVQIYWTVGGWVAPPYGDPTAPTTFEIMPWANGLMFVCSNGYNSTIVINGVDPFAGTIVLGDVCGTVTN